MLGSLILLTLSLTMISGAYAQDALPKSYTELLDYVVPAPDQGGSNACLYVASTGAMEIIANKKEGIKNPEAFSKFDLSETYLIHAPEANVRNKSFWEWPVLKFNTGFGIHINDWPFAPWNGSQEGTVWNYRKWNDLPKVTLPKVETIPLFIIGEMWSTNVLKPKHVQMIKEALWKHKAPVLVNYHDDNFSWHVILIVGYDDDMPGNCHEISDQECGKVGSFYVRDSFGVPVGLRDYNWFRIKGNAAFVIKEVL